jgi:hypothetical protein
MTSLAANLHEDLCTLLIPRPILLKITNVLVKMFRENQNKHFMFDNFFSENCTVCETIGKNMVVADRPQ